MHGVAPIAQSRDRNLRIPAEWQETQHEQHAVEPLVVKPVEVQRCFPSLVMVLTS